MSVSSLSWHEVPRGVVLESPHWRLNYDLPLGLFDLASPAFPGFAVRWARARAQYRRGKNLFSAGTDDGQPRHWQVDPVEHRQGPGLRLVVQTGPSRRPTLEFSATLYQDVPFLVLELALFNTLSHPITVEALKPLEVDPEWGGKFTLGTAIGGLYYAGWQSWSPAGWKPTGARDLRTALGPFFAAMHDSPRLRPLRQGQFRADLVGALTPAGDGPTFLAGLLSTADQFGSLEVRLGRARPGIAFICAADGVPLAPQERLASEQVALRLSPRGQSPLEAYGDALGEEMESRVQETPPVGWCSWPAFGSRVGEKEVLEQLACLSARQETFPSEVLQVDDGWQQAVGDWEPNERFPHGMRWLAQRIREAGFRPGIWLAPLIVHPRSRMARTHPEWLLRDERGRPVSAGFSSVGFSYGLDATRPEVQDFLRLLVRTVVEDWGYSYLKLDFLYAGALPGRRHRPEATRAQALRRALEIVREAAGPETTLLGCGCPLGPAVGIVDTMRVEQDVAVDWKPRLGLATPLLRSDPSFPATVNTVRNILTRAWTHRRLWLNDPDPLILREIGSRLTRPEVRTLVTAVALSGGTWMVGDNLTCLEEASVPLATAALPPHRGQAVVPDVLGREYPRQVVLEVNGPWGHGWVVALFNWEEQPADLEMGLGLLGLTEDTACHLHEFWSGEYRRVQGTAHFAKVQGHGCRVFLLCPVEEFAQWAGSTLHLVQGTEVQDWQSDPEGVALTLSAGRVLNGSALLWLPQRPRPRVVEATGASETRLEAVTEGLWRLRVRSGPGPARVVVGYGGKR